MMNTNMYGSVLYSIGIRKKSDNTVLFLAHEYSDDLDAVKRKVDEWYEALTDREGWNLFVVESIPNLLHLSHEESLHIFHSSAVYVR